MSNANNTATKSALLLRHENANKRARKLITDGLSQLGIIPGEVTLGDVLVIELASEEECKKVVGFYGPARAGARYEHCSDLGWLVELPLL